MPAEWEEAAGVCEWAGGGGNAVWARACGANAAAEKRRRRDGETERRRDGRKNEMDMVSLG